MGVGHGSDSWGKNLSSPALTPSDTKQLGHVMRSVARYGGNTCQGAVAHQAVAAPAMHSRISQGMREMATTA
jgi:hypothetical protein